MSKRICFRLDRDEKKKIQKVADDLDSNMSDVFRKALQIYLVKEFPDVLKNEMEKTQSMLDEYTNMMDDDYEF